MLTPPCQQHTIPALPQNIHIQTQQKLGGKYDVRPGFYPEPGCNPPGLLPADKAGSLEVSEDVHHPDVINVLVHSQPSFQAEAAPKWAGSGPHFLSSEILDFQKAIIPHLYLTLLPQAAGRQQTDCVGAHHGNLTPPRISPSCPHCLIPVSPGAVAGQEYHYQIADEGRAG
ncbi:hypothetical protein HMPREF0372_03924 [Flavonifractor plautii ATCC 29863]|uniref:Uncharacterized protein n=1 Tax=Flavonifractor plautii ATCC 29863 TaxID=411475 RepID=G9YWK7_FLAPL|nr:hypothetical protein HMPREF0372_03924 [Flavonifractor plautii ATCC 29863]